MRTWCFWALLLCLAFPVKALASPTKVGIKLSVDATEVRRKILHAKLIFPATPGPLRLLYPKWIPADHRPSGPISDLVGLRFTAAGKSLTWHRDVADMYAFQIEVPSNVESVEAEFDLVGPPDGQIFHLGLSTTAQLMVLNWNQVVLYPEEKPLDDIIFSASLHLPQGWKLGTALAVSAETGGILNFEPVALKTLVDSPVIAGSHFREVEITPPGEKRRHFLEIAADSEAALAIPEQVFGQYRRLVSETGALFGARHYNSYRFLVALQGQLSDGDEHHESSDNRLPEMGMVDVVLRMLHGSLLAHEMTHSWNGKYRRPKGLATADYQQPMKGDLLWIYEGLTDYLGRVLAARSGLLSPAQYRDAVAELAAKLARPGRTWRPLSDTAVAAQLLYDAPDQWQSWRRGVDFYDEGTLLWLEIDTIIRKESRGSKSLDDFCRRFAGAPSGAPEVLPYTLEDVLSELNAVVPYDWNKLIKERLSSLDPRPPLNGIENSGWHLVYEEQPSTFSQAQESVSKQMDLRYSIGVLIAEDGELIDVVEGSPASRAGAAPGMKIAATDKRRNTPDVLRQELASGKKTSSPLELLVTSGQYFITLNIDYHDGERYPHLVRDTSHPDLLQDILAPRAPVE